MNDINRYLHDADPVGREPGLTPEAVAELRRVVVTAAQEPARAALGLLALRTFAVAATAALTATERTQVQFSTPGGTRIVWTIDPSFHIKGKR